MRVEIGLHMYGRVPTSICTTFTMVTLFPQNLCPTLSIKSLRACIVKKQISSLARVRAAVAPHGLVQELHLPLGALGTELQCLTTPAFESITCGPDR